ncbi:MAG: sigma-70 family RNA polymerase sigma factor [Anaerolineae bacterium]|nr:sigma-70 family RNA polymerase sigma factor [Anaerolineae bacterium]
MSEDFSNFTVYLVGHAHIDLGYRWRWNETVHRIARDTFRGVLRMMDAVPEFTFVQSQLALYEAMKQHYPEMFAEIKARIAEGRWIVADGWCEYDQTMPGGESIIRQHLLGSRYAREELGCAIALAWAPDAFSGHVHTLPTLLKGCGIDRLLYGRGVPDKVGPYFWWEGPDGSRVLAYSPAYGYSADLGPRVFDVLGMWRELTGDRAMLFLYGRGDHGGGPREGDFEALDALRREPGAPCFVHTTPQTFFDRVLAAKPDLPVYRGELGGGSTGSCSSVGRAKQRNRQMEGLLLTVERFATLAMFLQRKPSYPRVDLQDAWRAVLHHQFHDELPGTSCAGVYLDNERDYARVEQVMAETLDASLAEIAARLDTRGDGAPLVVYNPLAWTRSEPVQVTLRLNALPDQLTICDTDGQAMPTQTIDLRQKGPYWYADLLFLAQDVPALGYRVFRTQPPSSPELDLSVIEQAIFATQDEIDPDLDIQFDNLAPSLQALARENRKLIVDIARQFIERGFDFADLVQAGKVGLLEAMKKFDDARDRSFDEYAAWWIRQAIARAIAEQTRTVSFSDIPGMTSGATAREEQGTIVLENEDLRVTISTTTGQIASVWDKAAGREALGGPGNVLQVIDEIPHEGTAWIIALTDRVDDLDAPESVAIVRRGPVQAAVRVAYRHQDSYFVQEIALRARQPCVDCRLHAHWYERDRCLKVAFPVAVEGGTATFEAPLGSIVRPADGAEVPAQRWIDLSNDGYGVSLLNDCRYAFDVLGTRLRMTLLRGFPDMAPEADIGEHDLHWALYGHRGPWQAAGTVRRGWAFNMPLIARQAMRRAGVIAPWIAPGINHAMPPAFGFLEVEPENVVLSAFKLEQEDWGPGSPVVIRLYETAGQAAEARVRFAAPLMMFEETNHLEEPIASEAFEWDEDRVSIRFRPHEVMTFRLRLAIPAFAIYEGETHREDIAPGTVPGFGDG